MQRALQEQLQFLQRLIDTIPNPVFYKDVEGKYLGCNKAFETFFGLSRERIMGKAVYDLASQELAAKYHRMDMELIRNPGVRVYESRVRHDDGTWRDVIFNKATYTDDEGGTAGLIGVMVDITDRKRLEEQVSLAKQDWEYTFNSITDMITVHDRDFNIILANKAAEKILGLPVLEKTPGTKCFNYYHASAKPLEGCPGCGCLQTGMPVTVEIFEPHLDMFIEIRAIPRFDSNNELIGLIHVVRDISEKKKAEDALKVAVVENVRLIGSLDERVRERTGKLEAINLELKAVNRELEVRRMEAVSASKTKTDFLAAMSHELRTPLNAIIGFSEILSSGMAGSMNEKQKEFTADIYNSGQHLLSLIDDILDLSKIEAGKMGLELSCFELGELVRSSVAMFKEKSLRQRIRLETDIEQTWLTADMRKLKQVFVNLLSNAFKFTPEGGSVRVTARRWDNVRIEALKEGQYAAGDVNELCLLEFSCSNKEFIEISVSDTGIGISEKNQKRLFMPFHQVETKLTRKYSGTGLGLSLCRRIVDMHQGLIWLESKEGEGSRFTFVIPVTRSLHPNAIIAGTFPGKTLF